MTLDLAQDIVMLLANDHGVATKGSVTTIEDLSKNWEDGIWAGATLLIFIESTLYIRRVTANTNTKLTFNALPDGVKANKGDKWALKQGPGAKATTTILDEATIAADATTALGDCAAIDLSAGPATLALTIEATYNGAATQGIKIHVRTSPDGTNFDNIDWDSWTPSFTTGATIRQTKHYDVSPYAIKVLVENLDPAEAVTAVKIIATVGP